MAMPSNGGALYFSQIQSEFGGSSPIYFSEYYRGGPYVNINVMGDSGAIATSGAIYISNFWGTQAADIHIVTNDIAADKYSTQWGFFTGYMGSVSDNTANYSGGAIIKALHYVNISGYTYIEFMVSGNVGNSGWTTVTMGPYSFTRASAFYEYDSGTNSTYWYWETTNNPFDPNVTATTTVSFV